MAASEMQTPEADAPCCCVSPTSIFRNAILRPVLRLVSGSDRAAARRLLAAAAGFSALGGYGARCSRVACRSASHRLAEARHRWDLARSSASLHNSGGRAASARDRRLFRPTAGRTRTRTPALTPDADPTRQRRSHRAGLPRTSAGAAASGAGRGTRNPDLRRPRSWAYGTSTARRSRARCTLPRTAPSERLSFSTVPGS
jgi:hypothetical protein